MPSRSPARPTGHVLSDLGHSFSQVGEHMHGTAPVVEEMFAPGTSVVRTSILACWVDVAAGLLAVGLLAPRVPTTLDLDVQLRAGPRRCERIDVVATPVKVGRSVLVLRVDLADETGAPYAVASAAFMAVPDPATTMPEEHVRARARLRAVGQLPRPFAEHARCVRTAPGVATLPRTDDGLNAANTINGALLALVAEEALLSVAGPGSTATSLVLRYVRPARVGPVVATATVRDGIGSVEVRDTGDHDRLAVFGTARIQTV